ncbi:hypothetical protein FOCC_FOCC016493 [Frankliniella occidentalis]|nr:hypothetical protein FOCC_FOCC016493 [Frankliniella occidentalis]
MPTTMKTAVLVYVALLAGVASALATKEVPIAKKVGLKQVSGYKSGLKIYNGNVAKAGQFAYYVAMYVNMEAFCGGSLIHPKWVLTAAHCVEAGSLWTMFMGALSMQLPKEEGRQVHVSRAAYLHPDYVRYGDFEYDDIFVNDVGLIQLPDAVSMTSSRIGVVNLPDPKGKSLLNKEPYVPGFGLVGDEVSVISSKLMYTQLPVASSDLCYSHYGIADPSVICVDTSDVKASTCGAEEQLPVFFRDVPGAPRSAEPKQEQERHGLGIYNGDVATRKQFPYQAALYIDLNVFCGGSLIHEKWVLTAAHCVEGGNIWYVLLGVTESLTPRQDGRRTYVTRGGIRHPDYNSRYILNDIGVIQLMRPATLSEYIQTVPLTPKNAVYIGTNPTVSGFGRTDDSTCPHQHRPVSGLISRPSPPLSSSPFLSSANASPISPMLRYTTLPVVSNDVCSDAYGSETGNHPSVICLRAEGSSSCKGDSGGPLVLQDDNGKTFQIGTVSFGARAGCSVGMPVGYGNVSLFIDWISETTGVDFS